MKSIFITFEGGEGCGKSTHARLLKNHLASKGHKVVVTHEPGSTWIGKQLRRILLKGRKLRSKYSELFLFAADRLEHVEQLIGPSLRRGDIVICDRFVDSTTAYQSGGRRLPRQLVDMVNRISSCGLIPDITFLLDIPPKKGIHRGTVYTGKDKFESENRQFHDRVRREYFSIARKNKKRVILISTEGQLSKVQERIRNIIDEKLRNKK